MIYTPFQDYKKKTLYIDTEGYGNYSGTLFTTKKDSIIFVRRYDIVNPLDISGEIKIESTRTNTGTPVYLPLLQLSNVTSDTSVYSNNNFKFTKSDIDVIYSFQGNLRSGGSISVEVAYLELE